MIFRDLIPEDEFYNGCDVYDNADYYPSKITLNLSKRHCADVYVWRFGGHTFTNNGIHYAIEEAHDKLSYIKKIICNSAYRIFPTKYKPL